MTNKYKSPMKCNEVIPVIRSTLWDDRLTDAQKLSDINLLVKDRIFKDE